MRAAIQALTPRGPDGSGFAYGAGWVLGHTRLAILDLSERASQPMTDGEGRWLVFNGEIYNFRELRAELRAEGCVFRSSGDSEVLLHALRVWGTACLPRLRGMFAFAWLDSARRELLLARDRYGVKPLCYEHRGSDFRFASNLFALRALPGSSQDVDAEAAFLYLGLGYVPAPHSILENVAKVRPGSFVHVAWSEAGVTRVQEHAYWSIADVPPAIEGAAEGEHVLAEYEQRVANAIESRLISDVPVGSLLSGGIDSALVTAIGREQRSGIPSFTMGFDDGLYDESPYARRIAERLGGDHREFFIGEGEALRALDGLWNVYDEPFADSSSIPMVELCRLVSRHVKVALSGDGGDEVFGGYPWHRALARAEEVTRFVPAVFRGLVPAAPASWSPARRYQSAVLAEPDRIAQWSMLRTGLNAKSARMLPVTRASQRTPFSERFRLWSKPLTLVRDPVDWACRMDLLTYLPDDLMVKADRASMSVGLELREPLLDHALTAWCLSLPIAARYDRKARRSKLLSRSALSKRMDPALFERPKQGFVPPLEKWLKGPLAPLVKDAIRRLERGELMPLCLPEGCRDWNDCATALDDTHSVYLWRVVCFAEWSRHHCPARRPELVAAGNAI